MPPSDWRVRVRDMLDSIAKIRRYTGGMDAARFAGDEKTVDAVVMQLVVIGESARHVPPGVAARRPEVPWKLIAGMRNIIVHDYGRVSVVTVWRTVEDDLGPWSSRCASCWWTRGRKADEGLAAPRELPQRPPLGQPGKMTP